MSSLLYSLQTNCGNCGKVNQICTISVAYRCIDCRYINCLMCNKTHDMTCELFSKSNKNVSISSTNEIKESSIGETSKNKKKRSLNIQELNSDDSEPSKKAKIFSFTGSDNDQDGQSSDYGDMSLANRSESDRNTETESFRQRNALQIENNQMEIVLNPVEQEEESNRLERLYPDAAQMNRDMEQMQFPIVRFGSKGGLDKYYAATGSEERLPQNIKGCDPKILCRLSACNWSGNRSLEDRHFNQMHKGEYFCAYHITRTVVPFIWHERKLLEGFLDFGIPVFNIHSSMIRFNYLIFPKRQYNVKTALMNVFKLEERYCLVKYVNCAEENDQLAIKIRQNANKWMTQQTAFITNTMLNIRRETMRKDNNEEEWIKYAENLGLKLN